MALKKTYICVYIIHKYNTLLLHNPIHDRSFSQLPGCGRLLRFCTTGLSSTWMKFLGRCPINETQRYKFPKPLKVIITLLLFLQDQSANPASCKLKRQGRSYILSHGRESITLTAVEEMESKIEVTVPLGRRDVWRKIQIIVPMLVFLSEPSFYWWAMGWTRSRSISWTLGDPVCSSDFTQLGINGAIRHEGQPRQWTWMDLWKTSFNIRKAI